MEKITTVFARDWDGELGPPGRLVTRDPHPECGWVFDGEGVATRKLDGTSCLVRDGVLYKRLAIKEGRGRPDGFIELHWEGEPGERKLIGWAEVGDGPEDKWHRAAFDTLRSDWLPENPVPDGTYELVGPKVQGNAEHGDLHELVSHSSPALVLEDDDPPRDYDGLRDWLDAHDVEGVVWHHPDGRMAKIKGKDFGLRRRPAETGVH